MKNTTKAQFFIEEINKIALSWNDDKRMQSVDSIETHACGMSKDLVCKEEESKYNSTTKQCRNVNFDYIMKEDKGT